MTTPNEFAEARERLDADGQIVVRDLLPAGEVARFRRIVARAVDRSRKVVLPPGNETYQAAFDQHMNLWRVDPAVEAITLNPDLADVAATMLGVERVRVYHDQALIKRAGGGHTPWHQDQWYWPLDTDRTITMWLPLHDVDPAMGELEFALGTHHGPIGDEAISDDSDSFYADHLARRSITCRPTGAMRAGDASFHLGWTLHRAGANTTAVDRVVMTVIWFADGARVTEPTNDGQRIDRLIWLGDAAPGSLAAGDLNPLVGRPRRHER
jgi:ectoine hydroxylase-related dioxygenase (phytanoyl-CoA dioxygenase family)